MDKNLEIKRMLQNIAGGQSSALVSGKVTALQTETCTVDLGGMEVTDVRLKVSFGGESGNFAVFYPKVGSQVLLASLSGGVSDLAVLKIDEIQKFEIKQNDLSVLIDSDDDKIQIKNAETSLLELFQTLTQIIKDLKVYTGTGASGVPILTIQNRLNDFEIEFKQLLK
jgi:hypothetical protein